MLALGVSICFLFQVNVVSVTVSSVGGYVASLPKSAFWSYFSADCSSDNGCSISCPSSQLFSPDEEESALFLRVPLSITLTGRDSGRVPIIVQNIYMYLHVFLRLQLFLTAAVAQWARAFTPQAEDWMFKSRQT